MNLGGGGVTVNDNEISSKSKFKEFSIHLSIACLIGWSSAFFSQDNNPYTDNTFHITNLFYFILAILIYNTFNMIMCFLHVSSLNFVKFEQKHPVKSLIGRFSFLIPLIVLYFYIFYDILN